LKTPGLFNLSAYVDFEIPQISAVAKLSESRDSTKEESMNKKILRTLTLLAGALFVFSTLAFAEKPRTVTVLYDSILPDGQTLEAGDYGVQVDETAGKVQFLQKGEVIAEAPCDLKTVSKNERTEVVFQNDNGKRTLQSVRIKGDTKHIILEGAGT
jgi:hypothetical protein